MLRILVVSALVLAAAQAAAPEAQALGDVCLKDVRARGSAQTSMSAARASAMSAWEHTVAKRHGARFADWWYSGDRAFDCSWGPSGRDIRCVALAVPCGRKR